MTRLDGQIKRELSIRGKPFVLTLTSEGLKLTQKGRRKGLVLALDDLVSGEAAIATALNATLAQVTRH